ncbi:MAG: UDP-glucose--dolichyl-phosphate glucosyltransferase [Flavobacteriaceae bacterium]|nr:UDP-glucose--dolichyl-phosphate glucosyltransferase [Flavobacteriaceae bacterium]
MNKISVIIPALNEEKSISKVINSIPKYVDQIIVVDNGSTDKTSVIAKSKGAITLNELKKGYGYACIKAIEFLKINPPNIIVFLDGDYSDYPEDMNLLINPIINSKYEFVMGSRIKKLREPGSMTLQQVFGNFLACFLIKVLYGVSFKDLGPFRAIKWKSLQKLKMHDKTFGWTIEMQLKAIKHKLKYLEVPVKYRNRIGKSKISGTLSGTIKAGYKILLWIFKYYFKK